MPVAEVAAAFASDPGPDPASWFADLATADEIFGPDEPTDPFTAPAQ